MTDVQYRVLQNRAARTAQKYRLKLEKAVNALQAKLHSAAVSKAIISAERYAVIYSLFDQVKARLGELENAMADLKVAR